MSCTRSKTCNRTLKAYGYIRVPTPSIFKDIRTVLFYNWFSTHNELPTSNALTSVYMTAANEWCDRQLTNLDAIPVDSALPCKTSRTQANPSLGRMTFILNSISFDFTATGTEGERTGVTTDVHPRSVYRSRL